MKRAVIAIWLAVTVAMAAITFTPDGGLTAAGSAWFVALWVLFAGALAAGIVKWRMWRNLPSAALHASMLLILAGGLASYAGRESRMVRLSPGVPVELHDGCSAVLDSFVIDRYPGSVAPRDFRSSITLADGQKITVGVNRPAQIAGGYTLRQQAYDSTGSSIIEVSRDPWGIPLSFSGYALFAAAFAAVLLNPRGRFRKMLAAAAVMAVVSTADVRAAALPGISEAEAEAIGRRQVMWNGRVVPFNTAATELCRKLSGTTRPGGMSAERVVASIVLYPGQWREAKILMVDGNRLRRALGVEGKYCSIDNLFAGGRYRLKSLYGLNAALDKDILALDERMELMQQLAAGELIAPLPEDAVEQPAWRVTLEILYNRLPVAQWAFMGLLACGFILLVARRGAARWIKAAAWIITACQALSWIARWVISGTVPLGSGGESMQFLSVVIAAVALSFGRRHVRITAVGTLAAGFAALVAWLSLRNPAITPLMPVLHSPWLSIHVTLIMLAYALLTLTSVVALTALISPRHASLRRALLLLYPALALLGAGIFTGAVWAQVSWGRYWAWDPKETWALITMLTYALPLHRFARLSRRATLIWLAAAILPVLMTYFGVNYLPSLHAYN